MARAWRIEYEGAYYHLLSRGNEHRDIFLCGEDLSLFLNTMPGSTETGEDERRADPGHAERRTGSHGGAAAPEGNIVGVDEGIQEQRQDCRRHHRAGR